MTGEALYNILRSAAHTLGFTREIPGDGIIARRRYVPLPYWHSLDEKEKQVWEETAKRLPIERQTGVDGPAT